ncbi:MAG: complex I subunit 5 family protein [Nitriliruptoraceae bacterium]
METSSLLPLAAVVVPVVTSVLIGLLRRTPAIRDATLVVGALVTFGIVAVTAAQVLDGQVPTTVLGELVPGLTMSLAADGMGTIFAVLASFLWVLAGSYAIGYMRGDHASNQTRFYAFYSLCLATAFGVAFAGDLLTFFIAYELLTVTTYPLVTHKGDAKALKAGRTYLGYLLSGGALVLLAMMILVATTGDLTFVAGGFVGDQLGTGLTILVFALFAIGFGTKAGLMPLHPWLPGAMVAPTPVSALLHAVAVVKGGVFAFGRFLGFVLGPAALSGIDVRQVLTYAAAITIVVASIVALRQDHLKRRLAYSTIAHLAYIVLGFSLLSPSGFEGSLLHILNHGVAKITLFFAAGAIHIAAHKDHVSELDGIGRRMPFTMIAFALASFSLAGLPPAGGFVSKFTLVSGALEAGEWLAAAVMVFSGMFTAAYLFPIVYRAFFKTEPGAAPAPVTAGIRSDGHGPLPGAPAAGTEVAADPTTAGRDAHDTDPHATDAHDDHHAHADHGDHGEAAASMVVPIVITGTLAVVLGLGDWTGLYGLAAEVAAAVTGVGG